jgi:hypothetical protein
MKQSYGEVLFARMRAAMLCLVAGEYSNKLPEKQHQD